MDEQRRNPFRREPPASKPSANEAPRKPRGLRELPSDLHALADGRADRIRRPYKPRDPIEDDRVGHVIPGVRNSEARAVYDRRVLALRRSLEQGDEARLAEGLAEAQGLGLWRARNITDFGAFAENVVGVDPERAVRLAQVGAERLGASAEPLALDVVALWVRTEAALAQVCPEVEVCVARSNDRASFLQVQLPVHPIGHAVEALRGVGAAVSGLTRFMREPPPPPREERRPEPGRRKPARDTGFNPRERGGRFSKGDKKRVR